jgi:hypothetical protein
MTDKSSSPELALVRAARTVFEQAIAALEGEDRKVIAEAINAGASVVVSLSHEPGPKGNATIECGCVCGGRRMMFAVKTLERLELN